MIKNILLVLLLFSCNSKQKDNKQNYEYCLIEKDSLLATWNNSIDFFLKESIQYNEEVNITEPVALKRKCNNILNNISRNSKINNTKRGKLMGSRIRVIDDIRFLLDKGLFFDEMFLVKEINEGEVTEATYSAYCLNQGNFVHSSGKIDLFNKIDSLFKKGTDFIIHKNLVQFDKLIFNNELHITKFKCNEVNSIILFD